MTFCLARIPCQDTNVFCISIYKQQKNKKIKFTTNIYNMKNMEILRDNLVKYTQDLCTEKYKTLLRKMKDNLNYTHKLEDSVL